MGFSLGGMIAQQLAAAHPEMVRRVILSGTGPRGGEGMVSDLSVDELDDEAGLIMNAFFTQSEPSKAAGRAFIERTKASCRELRRPGVEAGGPRRGGCYPRVGRDPPDGPFCDVGQNPPSDADCAWEQGRRHQADQCVSSRSASHQCSAHHVPGCEPRCIFAVCRELPGKCEAVSQWLTLEQI